MPLIEFDYLKYSFRLAMETRKLFEMAGAPGVLQGNVVKSNIYYWASTNVDELNRNRHSLSAFDMHEECYQKMQRWTLALIHLSNPKLIICEGKFAFDEANVAIQSKYKCLERSTIDGNYKAAYEGLDCHMIGYPRYRSGIKNKDAVAKLLRKELDRIGL